MNPFKNMTWRPVAAALGAAALLTSVGAATPTAYAKEYNVAGTVDCGVRSGRLCPASESIFLITSDISGRDERWEIDITWVQKKLGGFYQDEAFDFEVMDRPDARGGIQAVGITGEGSFVNRLNFGVREEYTVCRDSIRASVGRATDDDEALARRGVENCRELRNRD